MSMDPEGWEQFWALNDSLRSVQKRGAPRLGDEVLRDGKRYVCVTIKTDGRVGYVDIPDGMTAEDLGRKFKSSPETLWERV